jgi:hypothetical protein
MSLSNLPQPVAEFLIAVRSGDDASLSATLADEVLMSGDRTEVRGKAAVGAWFTTSRLRWARPPRPHRRREATRPACRDDAYC